jgi:flagellar biosynthesis/type III secretory pathway ATPase
MSAGAFRGSCRASPRLSTGARPRAYLAAYEAKRDLVLLGAYAAGTDPALDAALGRIDRIEAFLRQDSAERVAPEHTLAALAALV